MKLLQKWKALKNSDEGFSLVELILVIFLILVIAAIILAVRGNGRVAAILGIAALAVIGLFILMLVLSNLPHGRK